jgi:hypothetical protein
LATPAPALGFVRRRLAEGDLYFIANTGNTPLRTAAHFLGDRGNGNWWDALRGRQWPAGSGAITIDLAPYESRFLLFAGAPRQAVPQAAGPVPVANGRWTLSLADRPVRALPAFESWTGDPATRYFSGTAVYRGTFDLAASLARKCLALDFGTPGPREPSRSEARPFAVLNAPVRDAAMVWVNGAPAGSVWAPPYRLDLPGKLRPGRNTVEVRVSNTAINRLAGEPRADYRLLHARFGERFTPQDQDKIAASPSGLLQEPRLVSVRCG